MHVTEIETVATQRVKGGHTPSKASVVSFKLSGAQEVSKRKNKNVHHVHKSKLFQWFFWNKTKSTKLKEEIFSRYVTNITFVNLRKLKKYVD